VVTPPTTIGAPVGDPTFNDPPPCNVLGIDRNFRTPYISTWTLGIQHTFTKDLALDLAYVGNHSNNLIGIRDINQGRGRVP
jgi:hypothetical protein